MVMSTDKMIGWVIAVVIFTSLIGVIAANVANPDANLTGAALAIFSLITLIVVALFIGSLTKGMKK